MDKKPETKRIGKVIYILSPNWMCGVTKREEFRYTEDKQNATYVLIERLK